MSTLIVSLVIIGGVILLIMAFVFINKRNRKAREQNFINLFNKTGEENGLSFSSQEVFRNKVIGLDGIRRKFVVVNENEISRIISLDDVRKCSMQKHIETYTRADEKSSGYEMFVKSIFLQFDFKDKRPAETIIFYDNLLQPHIEEKLMEAKAKDWEIILSKMIIDPVKERI